MKSPHPSSSLCWAVTRMAAYVDAALEECDLTSRQYRMLVAIAEEPVSATVLAYQAGVAPPTATIMVRGLIQRGAVHREAAVEDQRRIWLSVTDEGRRLLQRAESLTRERMGEIALEFGDDDRARLTLESLAGWNPALDRYRVGWLERHVERREASRSKALKQGRTPK